MDWDSEVIEFLNACFKQKVALILVGGGAVNFHGYQRQSADLDFWIDNSPENLRKLKKALHYLGYEFKDFPKEVKEGSQNISLKLSPQASLSIELITVFSLSKTFAEALKESEEASIAGYATARYRVLSRHDLMESKLKSGRPKDLLDIQELKRREADNH